MKPRIGIKRMWRLPSGVVYDHSHGDLCQGCDEPANEPVLVIPDNPAARKAMVERVVKNLTAKGKNWYRAQAPRRIAEIMLSTALSLPSRRGKR